MNLSIEAAYDKKQLGQLKKSFKAMSDEAVEASKKVGYDLALLMVSKVQNAARTVQEQRIAATGRAVKSSKIGEFSFGYAKKAFSGGGFTSKNLTGTRPYGDGIMGGVEFGSDHFNQFRPRTARDGQGNKGYFIFPTLAANQPEIIARWEQEFEQILKEW